MPNNVHVGSVALIGKPNAGKSTLLNHLIGEKISIISARPQTTRTLISGIYQDANAQIVFYDTPGVNLGKNLLSQFMMQEVEKVLKTVDFVFWILDASESWDPIMDYLFFRLNTMTVPVWVILNKIDLIPEQPLQVLKHRFFKKTWPLIEIQANQPDQVERLLHRIKSQLPLGIPQWDSQLFTEMTLKQLAEELIREPCLMYLRDEIPYGIAVQVETFKEAPPPSPVIIEAILYVEKESHRGILIGAQGQQLKSIGAQARISIEKLLNQKVFLKLWVKVARNWRKNPVFLKKFGYHS